MKIATMTMKSMESANSRLLKKMAIGYTRHAMIGHLQSLAEGCPSDPMAGATANWRRCFGARGQGG